MDINQIPSTVYIAAGTLLASLIAGVFSYLNMIASKENKVSEFRLVWIDGLRNEVADFCSAMLGYSLVMNNYKKYLNSFDIVNNNSHLKWLIEISNHRSLALSSITKIRLRLNHQALDKDTPEKELLSAIDNAREKINKEDFGNISETINRVRATAAPILKSSWETVKRGETGYIIVRRSVEASLILILLTLIFGAIYQYRHSVNQVNIQEKNIEKIIKSMKEIKIDIKKNNNKQEKNESN
ncbi:hypothetical protein BW31_03861 [Pantoea agglomerans]|uniref:hypothetical protein n=1 Tax=Enterobacter agglomerans TaxID=549 RepID=UPI00044B97A9|nr:hypothetical protein [Pantoea agglomerans]EZI31882.1 hypothetical protein BW31_03861 [Pantoea agglomerans]